MSSGISGEMNRKAMTESEIGVVGETELGERAAEQLFNARNKDEHPEYEPTGLEAAQAAVRRLGQLYEELPGSIAIALDAARQSGELLSSDRFQGLSEIVQNADDVDATEVRFMLMPNELLVCHNGNPVRLEHVLGLATPWFSTKSEDGGTMGRFGVGLMTLRSLSSTLEVHCYPYHVRLGDTNLFPTDARELPPEFDNPGWTVLRVPLDEGRVNLNELESWLDRWDHTALLFLRHITRVVLLGEDGETVRELALSRLDEGIISTDSLPSERDTLRQFVRVGDGRSWMVYSQEVPTPKGVLRARKATGPTTPVGVAIPLDEVGAGQIHAGLPVVRTRLHLFVNAQFDPLTSRRDLADNNWNQSLMPLVTDLWTRAALDVFSRDPESAWRTMPVPEAIEEENDSPFLQKLEAAIVDSAVRCVASQLSFPIPELEEISLPNLAVEQPPLEGILTESETAALAELPATLPYGVRDSGGTWRSVLESWRRAGASLPQPISVEQALVLLGDETRSVVRTISLVAAAVDDGLGQSLLQLPCVVAENGSHIVPPPEGSPEALAGGTSSLAEELRVVTLVHPEHLRDGKAPGTVLDWLRKSGALLDASDDRVVVRRLAAAGQAGRTLSEPLTDEQVQALRGAFELLDPEEMRKLGPDVGKAILLEGYVYEIRGKRRVRKSTTVRPVEAYLSKGIDRDPDSFAVAAEGSPGIVWLHDRYARIIRSPAGRQGVGAQKFLRLLGAETAPRLRSHPRLERRFANNRLGLRREFQGSSAARTHELVSRGATFTLLDRDCPHLMSVIRDISRIRSRNKRRRRAGALLGTLGRGWERLYSDFSEVDSANDSQTWRERGRVSAAWLWDAGEVAWLDDESGSPRMPRELRARTPGNEAIHGKASPDYLHGDLYNQVREEALVALGISGNPTRSEMVERLKEIRDGSDVLAELSQSELMAEAGVVYKALAGSMASGSSTSDLSPAQIRIEFGRAPGLVLTDMGWLPPAGVFGGAPIFGKYRPFAPSIDGAGPLWTALSLREPSVDDCIEVVRQIAKGRRAPSESDETILLETLRTLSRRAAEVRSQEQRRKLGSLPLWTSKGWSRERPVFATADAVMGEGLRDRISIWEPGGELEQFRPLLGLLRVREICSEDVAVVESEEAFEDEESTDFFRLAVQLLREDLTRNDPELALGLGIGWERLSEFSAWVHPALSLSVSCDWGGMSEVHLCDVNARVDLELETVFVRTDADLKATDGGGRALAELFQGNSRNIAMAWRAACDRAEAGRTARPVELAKQLAERRQAQTEEDIRSRTEAFRDSAAARRRTNHSKAQDGGANKELLEVPVNEKRSQTPVPPMLPRVLVDPQDLKLTYPEGRIEEGSDDDARGKPKGKKLKEPSKKGKSPANRVSYRAYTDLDKETVGMDLFMKLFGSDREDITDLRNQRGVGADALDNLRRFFELKVHAGGEPDQVKLTNAEVGRALSTDDYFLVVVSDVEGADARPKVRVVLDPLKQLQPLDQGEIVLSGVKSSTSTIYYFSPVADSAGPKEEDEPEGGEEDC